MFLYTCIIHFLLSYDKQDNIYHGKNYFVPDGRTTFPICVAKLVTSCVPLNQRKSGGGRLLDVVHVKFICMLAFIGSLAPHDNDIFSIGTEISLQTFIIFQFFYYFELLAHQLYIHKRTWKTLCQTLVIELCYIYMYYTTVLLI